MNLKDVTIEILTKENPELIEKIKASLEDAERITNMENEFADLTTKFNDLKTSNDELKTSFDTMKGENDSLKKENEDLKKKLDTYEQKEKKEAKEKLISEKIEVAKLPKEAITAIWMNDLLMKDETAIESAIQDRKDIWAKVTSGVKGQGMEYKADGKEGTKNTEEIKEAKESFVSKVK